MKKRFGDPFQPIRTGIFLFKEHSIIASPEYQLKKVRAQLKHLKAKEDLMAARALLARRRG